MEYSLTLYKNGKLTPRGKKIKKTFSTFGDCKDYLYKYPSNIVKFLTEKANYDKDNLFIVADHNINPPTLNCYSLYRVIIKYMSSNSTHNLIDFLIKIDVKDDVDPCFDSWLKSFSINPYTASMWSSSTNPIEAIQEYIDYSNKKPSITTIYPISAEEWRDAKYHD